MSALGRFLVNSLSTTVQRWNTFWFESISTQSVGVARFASDCGRRCMQLLGWRSFRS